MDLFTKRPLVSVIMASYNHAAFVGSAVTSIIEQDTKNIELIVVDDGSSDATPDIVAGIKDPRIRLIRLNPNRRFHPRNLGLKLARGHYAAFQNSDDEWSPGKLTAQLQVLENNKRIVACFTGTDIIGEQGELLTGSWANPLFTRENRDNTAWLRHFFDRGNCLCLTSAVVRLKQTRQAGGFRASLIQLSDLDLWVRLAALGNFHIIDKNLTRFRVVQGTNLSRPSASGQRRSLMDYCEVLGRYTEPPVLSCLSRSFADIIPQKTQSPDCLRAGLALHALSLGSPSHRIFADRVLSRLLDNPLAREEVVAQYGTLLVREFIKNRGELELNVNCGEEK
jgi:glycosyltransferase involved in cell wall biosynthesis